MTHSLRGTRHNHCQTQQRSFGLRPDRQNVVSPRKCAGDCREHFHACVRVGRCTAVYNVVHSAVQRPAFSPNERQSPPFAHASIKQACQCIFLKTARVSRYPVTSALPKSLVAGFNCARNCIAPAHCCGTRLPDSFYHTSRFAAAALLRARRRGPFSGAALDRACFAPHAHEHVFSAFNLIVANAQDVDMAGHSCTSSRHGQEARPAFSNLRKALRLALGGHASLPCGGISARQTAEVHLPVVRAEPALASPAPTRTRCFAC